MGCCRTVKNPKLKCFLALVILIELILFTFIIVAFKTLVWVESDADKSFEYYYCENDSCDEQEIEKFDSSCFEGTLLNCIEGCGQKIEYKDLLNYTCGYDHSFEAESVCKAFKELYFSGTNKKYFDGFVLLFICLSIIFKIINRLMPSAICCVCYSAFYYSGSILWIAVAPVYFNGYGYFPDDGGILTLRAADGPRYTLLVANLYHFLLLIYITVIYKCTRNDNKESESTDLESIQNINNPPNEDENQADIFQSNLKNVLPEPPIVYEDTDKKHIEESKIPENNTSDPEDYYEERKIFKS